jgi:deoxyribose-phosphate aldolase
MKAVFTSADLQNVAPGGEVVLAADTLVTELAREDAARLGITLRLADSPASSPLATGAAESDRSRIVVAPAEAAADEMSTEGLIRTVIAEVLRYLSFAPRPPSAEAGDGGPARANRGAQAPAAADGPADQVVEGAGPKSVASAIAALIDHTLLKPDASRSEIEQLCREAVHFGFASVCVNPWYVPLAARMVRGSAVKVCTVVGFPFGATLPQIKMGEAQEAIKLGAQEIDVVQSVGALKSGQDELVEADLRGVVEVSHRAGAICKAILETAVLTREEKIRAALAAKRAGADFVKTSTGFASGGATAEDVALLRAAVGGEMGVKASGGIRSLADLRAMVNAGATRIGASASVKIMQQALELAGDEESASQPAQG